MTWKRLLITLSMTRRKQIKIDEVGSFANVFQDDFSMKGQWKKKHFGNEGDLTLEIGCGHGQYILALSEKYPDENFVGIDLKGSRIWSAANLASERKNAAYVVGNVEKLCELFAPGEVDKIWVTFPDPYPKPCKANKRLISPRFIELYKKVLKPGGTVHFKTDNTKLFEYSLEHIRPHRVIRDLHASDAEENLKIKTFYEKKFMDLGQPINYLEFTV